MIILPVNYFTRMDQNAFPFQVPELMNSWLFTGDFKLRCIDCLSHVTYIIVFETPFSIEVSGAAEKMKIDNEVIKPYEM
jgi:hypothetical protein